MWCGQRFPLNLKCTLFSFMFSLTCLTPKITNNRIHNLANPRHARAATPVSIRTIESYYKPTNYFCLFGDVAFSQYFVPSLLSFFPSLNEQYVVRFFLLSVIFCYLVTTSGLFFISLFESYIKSHSTSPLVACLVVNVTTLLPLIEYTEYYGGFWPQVGAVDQFRPNFVIITITPTL